MIATAIVGISVTIRATIMIGATTEITIGTIAIGGTGAMTAILTGEIAIGATGETIIRHRRRDRAGQMMR